MTVSNCFIQYTSLFPALILLFGCDNTGKEIDSIPVKVTSTVSEKSEFARSQSLHDFFSESYKRRLARFPMLQTRRGIKDDYDKWDDLSEQRAQEDNHFFEQELTTLRSLFNPTKLNTGHRLSYLLFESEMERNLADFKWRFHDYPVEHMWGWQSRIPAFLINYHQVESEADAIAYIARLRNMEKLLDQIVDKLQASEQRGIIAPDFVFEKGIEDCRNIISGAPFDINASDSSLFSDFKKKANALSNLDESRKEALIMEAENALLNSVRPGYEKLIDQLIGLGKKTDRALGVWALPDGNDYYRHELKRETTTNMSADEIHNLGLQEVTRIHKDMKELMPRFSFEGSLKQFFGFIDTAPDSFKSDDEAGKRAYLAEARELVDDMKGKLGRMFHTLPKADLVIKPVEVFREKSAGRAFYQRPSADGSVPGIFYANTYDMKRLPAYEMQALVFHEATPGHHMALAIAQEIEGIPDFQKYAGYTVYSEGWAHYAEYLAKEMGFYQDPYSEFGRLRGELIRAARLVADTGLHARQWSNRQTINYLTKNTPMSDSEASQAVQRYLVMPGQATTYTIGKLKILELREQARNTLGDKFDIRRFHDIVLGHGEIPVDVLKILIEDWIRTEPGADS